jgi:hypothetical protein
MADRYQDRPFPADDDYDRGGDPRAPARGESDPLAELARLIGQTDPFGTTGRASQPAPPRTTARDPYERDPYEDEPPQAEPDDGPPAGPPPWMQRANRQEIPREMPREIQRHEVPQQDYPSSVHPLQRYATTRAAPEPEPVYEPEHAYDETAQEPDPSRYDEALYGQLDGGEQQPHQAYADEPYAYQDGYDDGAEEVAPKRRGGMFTVVVVLALAVVGTGAAFAYRTYVGSPRSGEPPIIRADAGPTKIVPAPSDGSSKVPDRMSAGDGTEKIVPREEAPVDVNAKAGQSGPRVVFPPLNQNGNPPSAASVAPTGSPLANSGNGTLPNNEPRKVKVFSVHGDQPDGAASPVASPPPTSPVAAKPVTAAKTTAAPRNPPSSANASANAPMSLTPGGQPAPAAPPTRIAATNPVQTAPSGGSGGGYLVQVSSQRNEADAQASYRALQGKFPGVLGSRSPLIKRADLGDKGVYYRAMVGPFDSSDEASQFCGSLKTAGGQCVVQRN